MLMCKQEVEDERACDIMGDTWRWNLFVRQHNPWANHARCIPSQVTNSHASIENVQKNSACAIHTDIAQTVRKRICKNWSVQRQQRGRGLPVTLGRVLWYVPVSLLLLHCGHCLWDWTFPHGSRKQQTDVCARQHLSKQFWVWGLTACLPPRRALTYA